MATDNKAVLYAVEKAFIKAQEEKNAPPLYTLKPEEAREVLVEAQNGPVKLPEADVREVDIRTADGEVSVLIARPGGAQGPLPCLVYLHGGGWVMGEWSTHERLVRELAVGAGIAVAFPEYTPSPEAQYPATYRQVWSVLEELAANPDVYGIDGKRIAVGGDSAGGYLAIVMALLAKERQGPKLAFQLLFYPVTGADFDTESYRRFQDGPWLTREAMRWFWEQYLPDKAQRADMLASPVNADEKALQGLPPALVVTAENDVLRDEGEAFADKLDAAGVAVASVRVRGTFHDFAMLNALADSPATRAAVALAVTMLASHLGAGGR